MRMKTLMAVAAVAAAAVTGASGARVAAADAGSSWLHVRVEEPGKNTRVRVNLPLTVVEAALKAAPETIESEGRIHIGGRHGGGRHITVAELRDAWNQLKTAGDTDLVTVDEEDGDHVTVARRGDMVQVRVQDREDGDQVHVDVPTAVVDALLSAPGDELNVRAAMDELKRMKGEIVRVKDKDSTVRVWIDESVAQGEK
jgi:hypothetical protein